MIWKIKLRKFTKNLVFSLLNLKRNVWMSLVSITSTAFMLGLVGLFSIVLITGNDLIKDVENGVRISVFLDTDTFDNEKQIKNEKQELVDNKNYQVIYTQIRKIEHVKKIEWSSRSDELKKLIDKMGDNWKSLEKDSNPLHDVYTITVDEASQLASVSKKLDKIKGVYQVQYGKDVTEKIMKISKYTSLWGTVGIVILVSVAVFLISNTIKVTIMARKNEIEVMRLVGASNLYINAPFIIEGVWIGLLGMIIPAIGIHLLYNHFYSNYSSLFVEHGLSLLKSSKIVWSTNLILTAISIFVGFSSSLLSVRKYMKI